MQRTVFSLCFAAMALTCLLLLPASGHAKAIMGIGKCVDSCENDRDCIKDCREQFMSPQEAKEAYMQDFRNCFDVCYDKRGKEKEDCLEGCRDDYKHGRDLD
ncbi:hypothetical protein SAMN02745704_00314 [Paucidesulfovibrio gracilis DSM 16080]|uniref:Uncharacterized protein n=1 Tax=Paucidesulfovibrio gracilis DSM 16080 TaxID=1121449 RepID=A0A1T4W581_9BACT|nr:hypothetical protein [Paucidesulfovibrio gracilis]SKA72195.1 hypothetical protein SAMN02745704_00314 [Paucidesulfovibrio gracilis DSM 16080]